MYKLNKQSILRLADGAYIPIANGNTDYEAYKSWVAAGNTPTPEDPVDPNLAIQAQINGTEATTMVPRVVREFMLRVLEDYAARNATGTTTAAQLLASDSAYQKVKAVDDAIRVLRSKLK